MIPISSCREYIEKSFNLIPLVCYWNKPLFKTKYFRYMYITFTINS